MRELTFKICIFGNGGVGKSTLLQRYLTGNFVLDLQVTIGTDISSKTVILGDAKITLQIWDFAGEERFRIFLPMYIRGASGGIFMFDLTRPETLQDIGEWLNIFRQKHNKSINAPIILVGGKADLAESQLTSEKFVTEYVKSFNLFQYFESSAKTGENIEIIFETLLNTIMGRQKFS
ncbi:MAG: Rab family GTPase [Promethearchaeota archaeon]|jgi:small GTP-binding protein